MAIASGVFLVDRIRGCATRLTAMTVTSPPPPPFTLLYSFFVQVRRKKINGSKSDFLRMAALNMGLDFDLVIELGLYSRCVTVGSG